MAMFRALLERDPDSAPVHMLLGEALDAGNREKEATDEFEAAAKSDPRQPEVHFGLGYLYWKQKRYQDAERQFRAEIANAPDHVLSLAYLGNIMLRDARADQALPLLKKAEQLNGRLHLVHHDLGVYYLGRKQIALAVKEFQEAISTSPDNYDAHYRLARIYQQEGRAAEAAKEFAIVHQLQEQKNEEPLMRISGPR
jgi:Tfp pilus assembly protein PilF